MGGSQLVNGVRDDRIALSSAVASDTEICFMLASPPEASADVLSAQCRPVCTARDDATVSVSFHDTTLFPGKLPFIFLGASQQQYKDCDTIQYPEVRSSQGWICRTDQNSKKSAAGAVRASLALLLAALVAVLL